MSVSSMLRLASPVAAAVITPTPAGDTTPQIDESFGAYLADEAARPGTRLIVGAGSGSNALPFEGNVELPDATKVRKSIASALESVATYVPSEVLALYLTLVAMVAPSTDSGKWALFVGLTALLVVYVGLSAAIAKKRHDAMLDEQRRVSSVSGVKLEAGFAISGYVWAGVISVLAFTTYAMAIPGTPFDSILDQSEKVGAVAALVFAVLAPLLAELVGLPDLEQETITKAQAGA